MTWKTLGEALESALASALNTGDGDAEAFPVSPQKRPEPVMAPASWEEVITTNSVAETTAGEATQPGTKPASLGNAKGGPVHHKAQPQRRTGQPLTLFVIEGGGRPAGGGSSRAAHARLRGERRSNLKLVAG